VLKHEIEVEHVYQDPDNPYVQKIVHGGDGPSLLWLFKALIESHKTFTVRIVRDQSS